MDTRLQPVATGVSLALTVAVMYAICTAIWVVWQAEALIFLNDLFHGLDFRKLQTTEASYSIMNFVVPLIVLASWGFVAGTLYGFVHNALSTDRTA